MSHKKHSRIVVFDSSLRDNFFPLSLTKPTFDILCGTTTLFQSISYLLDSEITDLIVPKYLESLCRENNPGLRINEPINEECLAITALLNPCFPLSSELSKVQLDNKQDFIAQDTTGDIVFATFSELKPELLTSKAELEGVERFQVTESVGEPAILKGPWNVIQKNSEVIRKHSIKFSNEQRKVEAEVLGSRVKIAQDAEIQRYVTLDSRNGDIIIDSGARVHSFSHITGPAYIGRESVVRSARIREGTTIGTNAKISGEIEQSIISEYSNKSHDGFIGHSIVGSWVNLGAMTTNSDLKNTYGCIKVNVSGRGLVNTGLNKVGVFVGDMAKTAIGTTIMSGKSIGSFSQVMGNITQDIPSFTMYGKSLGLESKELLLESAIETQRRMMERRSMRMTHNYSEMIKSVFNLTSKDRSAASVKKGKFEFQE